jgi:predicted Zn-dependent protease
MNPASYLQNDGVKIFDNFREMKRIFGIVMFMLIAIGSFAQVDMDEQLAQEYMRQGAWDKAEVICKKLYNKSPGYYPYFSDYFRCLMQNQQLVEAEKIIRKQEKKIGKQPKLHLLYGDLYLKQGKAEKAKDSYNDAASTFLPNPQQQLEIIKGLMDRGLLTEAIKSINNARKLSQNPSLYTVEISKIYQAQNNKQGLIDEQLNIFEQSAYDTDLIQQNFQDFFSEKSDYELLAKALTQRLQADPDQSFYFDLLIWTYLQLERYDEALNLSVAMDKRMNGSGEGIYRLGEYCLNTKAFDAATKCFQAVIQKGNISPMYESARASILQVQKEKLSRGKVQSEDLKVIINNYELYFSEFGKKSSTAKIIKDYAEVLAIYGHSPAQAIAQLDTILTQGFSTSSFRAACKIDMGDYYIMLGEIWEAALLYGQVDKDYKDEPMGQMAKFKNAKLSYYAGEFEFSKAQLDILKGSTSQLYANDALNLSLLLSDNAFIDSNNQALRLFASADLLIIQNQFREAEIKLDSINLLFPENTLRDDMLWLKANMAKKEGNIPEGIEFLNTLVNEDSESIWADDALFTMAEWYDVLLNDKQKSMEMYKRILSEFPGSLYETEARKRYRALASLTEKQ